MTHDSRIMSHRSLMTHVYCRCHPQRARPPRGLTPPTTLPLPISTYAHPNQLWRDPCELERLPQMHVRMTDSPPPSRLGPVHGEPSAAPGFYPSRLLVITVPQRSLLPSPSPYLSRHTHTHHPTLPRACAYEAPSTNACGLKGFSQNSSPGSPTISQCSDHWLRHATQRSQLRENTPDNNH